MVRFPDPISKVGARWMIVMVLSSSKSSLDTLIVARLDAPVELGLTVTWIWSPLRVASTQLSKTEVVQSLTFTVVTVTSNSPPEASKMRLPSGVKVMEGSLCPKTSNPTIVMTISRMKRNLLMIFIMFIVMLIFFRPLMRHIVQQRTYHDTKQNGQSDL